MSSPAAWTHAGAEVEILVVASPTEPIKLLCEELRGSGYQPNVATSLAAARRVLLEREAQLAVIQLALSDGCGLDLLATTREAGVPAIVVSPVATHENVERAFRAGADDFVPEPIHVTGLVMRIIAMLRRSGASLPRKISFDGLEIDLESRSVIVDDAAVELTAREFDLLAYLAAHPGRVFTRQQLLASVWHSSGEWQLPATVTEHILRLRVRIEDEPARPRWLRTSRGVGYYFDRRAASPCTRLPVTELARHGVASERLELAVRNG